MIIAIDALSVGTAGGRNYAEMMVRYLLRIDKQNKYLVFVAGDKINGFEHKASNLHLVPVNLVTNSRFKRLTWQQLALPKLIRQHNIDLLYTLAGIDIFFAPCKTIIKIENMAPYDNEVISLGSLPVRTRLFFLRLITRFSARTASGVLTMSKTAEQILTQRVGFPEYKVRGFVYDAELPPLDAIPGSADTYGLSEIPFILSVSHIDHYKNLLELVLAYESLLRDENDVPLLVIAGRPRDKQYYESLVRLIQDRRLGEKIRLLGNVPRESLYQLYNRCIFLVFTSKVETCPNTLIEAMKCGVPIASSNRSVMPEICGDAVLYFDPDKPYEITTQMKQLLKSPQLRTELRQRSLQQGNQFSWEDTARKTLKFFEDIIDS